MLSNEQTPSRPPEAEPAAEERMVAYQVLPDPPVLRKASRRRGWIEQMSEHFAYRCLPLVIANQFGWDAINPATFTATWNGKQAFDDVHIEWAEGHWSRVARSHFGWGVLSFTVDYVFRTPPGTGLLVCGPPNWPKDGICALAGLVETDWAPTTFTMNWRFTRADHPVTFEAGEPICRIIPVDRRLVERLAPEIRLVSDDPELERAYREWAARRNQFIAESRVAMSPAHEQGWQKDYFVGQVPLWRAPEDHQKQLQQREFVDLRPAGQRPAAPVKPVLSRLPETIAAPKPQAAQDYSVVAATALMRDLTEAQRLEVLRQFCRECGRAERRCGCRRAAGSPETPGAGEG